MISKLKIPKSKGKIAEIFFSTARIQHLFEQSYTIELEKKRYASNDGLIYKLAKQLKRTAAFYEWKLHKSNFFYRSFRNWQLMKV